MALIKTSDVDVKLFVATDVYFFSVDNRPLREILKNVFALNDQLEDLLTEYRERTSFIAENPSVETGVGGPYVSETGGTIVRVWVGTSVAGSGGNFVVDFKVDGSSIYGNPANRPVLAFDDSDKIVVSLPPNISAGAVPPGGKVTVDIIEKQTGTPRWFRAGVEIDPGIPDYSAFSYDAP